MFHDWSSMINGVDVSNDRQNNIMNPESTYNELLANTMLPEWDNMVNGVDTLYKNNQFEFNLGNQNENNFVVNSEAYQEEFQMDATFHEWDYVDDRFDTLYTEHDISNNVLYQNAYERNDIENFEHNQHHELQVGMMFLDWNHAISEIKKYEKRQGFKPRLYHIEKLKNSDIRRRTIVGKHFGQPEMTKSKDPKKETTTKQIGCTWQVNLSCLEKENPNKIVYIAKLLANIKIMILTKLATTFRKI
ncbi:hypothetical protein C2G38_2206398 [Gigaspora rosea]|uniref:FAR1 domain-containing protein n=1 Tax=Gigaspora rosea TaxID=44941 RepID=A0A397UJN4_9GLOM|nr:hypothetical protein C2G38_2206398 [Gigaspora rosea]